MTPQTRRPQCRQHKSLQTRIDEKRGFSEDLSDMQRFSPGFRSSRASTSFSSSSFVVLGCTRGNLTSGRQNVFEELMLYKTKNDY